MKKYLFFAMMLVALLLTACDEHDNWAWTDINDPNTEYVLKEVTAPDEMNSVGIGAPFIATKPFTHVEMLYIPGILWLSRGDLITQLVYKGYNPGEPFTRHFTVWMSNTYTHNVVDLYGRTTTDTMTKVFEGDCTIAAGGSADERIPLLTITLDHPFEHGYNNNTLQVVIESAGEPVAQDVYFEQYNDRHLCCYTTENSPSDQWSPWERVQIPLAALKVATPVINLTGTVFNQDKKPVPNATVLLESDERPSSVAPTVYTGVTDSEGHFAIQVEEGNKFYWATVSAPGSATYVEYKGTLAKDNPQLDFRLFDAVAYKAGRRATIILPVIPDASAGKYFRLDRIEDNQIIFERELSPKANVPYVIIPDRDFTIDLASLDLTMEAGRTSIPDAEFIGSYNSHDYWITENQVTLLLDELSDEGYNDGADSDKGYRYVLDGGRIGALHAYVVEKWYYERYDVVLHDNTNGNTSEETAMSP